MCSSGTAPPAENRPHSPATWPRSFRPVAQDTPPRGCPCPYAQLDQTRTAGAPSPAGGGDLMTKLQQLAELKSQGLLSDAQFTAAKAKLLG